jgi:tetratricopeptide (TPR) repeat protein
MNSKSHISKKRVLLSAMILFAALHSFGPAAYGSDSLKNLDTARIQSFKQIGEAVARIDRSQKERLRDNLISFDFQKQVLTKSGECINALVALRAKSLGSAGNEEEKALFLKLREILKHILTSNEKIVGNLQEKTLDTLKDPGAFFKSAQWQEPQYLISLSSYWLGWNGYYASTLFAQDDPMFGTLLKESVKGFSRSFVDFQEEAVIVRSLLGRALCYGKLKSYDKAGQDLKTVKKKVAKDDPFYIRCAYEEIRMRYEAGNYEAALKALNALKEDFPEGKIPEDIRKNLDAMNSRALIALMEKQGKGKSQNRPAAAAKNPQRMFEELKQLADTPAGMSEMYRYVKENSDRLERLSYAELGPTAAMALGDMMFEKKEYDRALGFYLPLISDSPAFMADRMDGIWFRTAYSYCMKKQYGDGVYYLERFYKKFPHSDILSQAASLYYAAAARNYNGDKSQKAYNAFMAAAQLYIKKCSGHCPEMSDAHFKMGRHYQNTGKIREAADEFSKVNQDSPNYAIAKTYLLQYYVDLLESLEKNGRGNSDEAQKLYQKGASLISAYKKWGQTGGNFAYQKNIEPQMILLESKISLYGPEKDLGRNLTNLKDFEKRFPGKEKLFLEIFKLRMVLFQRLGMMSEGEEELKRFNRQKNSTDQAVAVLNSLAKEFDRLGCALKNEKQEVKSGRSLNFALMTYGVIAERSCNKMEYQKYCDAAQLGMARLYIDLSQPDKAEAVYREMLKRNPLSADAVFNLGNLYEKMGQWGNALDMWRKFSDGVKQGTYHWYESRYKTAYALSRLGDHEKACEILNLTLVLHPDLGSDALKDEYTGLQAKICKKEASP